MANFEEKVTSNFFKVKDSKAFVKELKENEIESFFEQKYDESDKFAVASYGSLFTTDENDNDFEYDDFINLIQKHICDDEIVVVKGIGNEKLRYLTADACIITKEKTEYIDFTNIIKNKLIDKFHIDKDLADNIS